MNLVNRASRLPLVHMNNLIMKAFIFAAIVAVAVAAIKLPAVPKTVLAGAFSADFDFGVSTSSYQVEGGWLEGGKGFSVWDVYSHIPGQIANGDTGDVANDMYHLYPSDIKIMAAQGVRNYRFSIAWNRIMPTGVAPINQEGVDYYNDLINQLIANGIEPHVTLYHSEMPSALTLYPHKPLPFLDLENFPTWFSNYADAAFELFGDRVKHWFTFNEPFCFSVYGVYGNEDPYTVAHTAIVSHATAVDIYRKKYLPKQQGTIGIVLNSMHFYPNDTSNAADVAAAQRGYDFWYGWFLDPIFKGDYPKTMRDTVGARLPTFTPEQIKLVKGSTDFVAINYYFPYVITPGTAKETDVDDFYKDLNITTGYAPEWPLSQTGWGIYATGLRDLLLYTKDTYNNIPTYITENGLAWQEDNVEEAVNDTMRQQYLHDHIDAVGQALQQGADVRGYFIWSFQDNLEWNSGFQMHFGIIWIDRASATLTRVIKNSFRYYTTVLEAFAKAIKK